MKVAENRLADALQQCGDTDFLVANHGFLRACGRPRGGRLLFAHGAGAGTGSPFMRQFVAALAEHDIQVLTFEFAYMQRISETGRRRPPPPAATLVAAFARWYELIVSQVKGPVWLGGKSMGGRIASLLAAQRAVDGLVIAGYPFHPPRSPEKQRLAHWPSVDCPALILQGERDPFGTYAEVMTYSLPANVTLKWLRQADHDFVPRQVTGLSQQNLIDEAARCAACFVRAEGRAR
ncbi:alpha/beta fold hydrolase [Halomonas cibimaris]